MRMTKKNTTKKSEKFKKGDLILLINNEDKDVTGVVLDVKEWPSEDASMCDVYVHWSNGKTYWCISDVVKRIGRMIKKTN